MQLYAHCHPSVKVKFTTMGLFLVRKFLGPVLKKVPRGAQNLWEKVGWHTSRSSMIRCDDVWEPETERRGNSSWQSNESWWDASSCPGKENVGQMRIQTSFRPIKRWVVTAEAYAFQFGFYGNKHLKVWLWHPALHVLQLWNKGRRIWTFPMRLLIYSLLLNPVWKSLTCWY